MKGRYIFPDENSLSEETKKMLFYKNVYNKEPYTFCIEYAYILAKLKNNNNKILDVNDGQKFFLNLVITSLDKKINEKIKIVELEEDLIPLIENTKNKIFYRPLFYDEIFINQNFFIDNYLVKGVHIINDEIKKDWTLFFIIIDIKDESPMAQEFYLRISLINPEITNYKNIENKDIKIMKKISNYIRTMSCNIVDLVEQKSNDDIKLIEINKSDEQNEKRVKRGKIRIPNKIIIKIEDSFKKYVNSFNSNKQKYSHKFIVRGHWRKYENKKIWIKPFWKGEGIKIYKDVVIK